MSPLRTSVLALGLLAMACAPGRNAPRRSHLPPPAPASRAGTRDPGVGPAPGSPRSDAARAVHGRRPRDQAVRRAIDTATALVGEREIVVDGVRWGDGCLDLVRAAFAEAGAPVPGGVRDVPGLYALARRAKMTRRGRPAPGDLVFLSDRPGGPPEHVGLVESVSAEGTALVLHRADRGVVRVHVNAGQPWKARTDAGRTLNDVLLVGAGRVTAGRLLVAYATVL